MQLSGIVIYATLRQGYKVRATWAQIWQTFSYEYQQLMNIKKYRKIKFIKPRPGNKNLRDQQLQKNLVSHS